MRTLKGAAAVALAIVLDLLVILPLSAISAEFEGQPEIYYVHGCEEVDSLARETRNCFNTAGGHEPLAALELSLHGVDLPLVNEGDGAFRILLMEHQPPSLLGGQEALLVDPLIVECANVRSSNAFPSHLMTFTVPNPLAVEDLALVVDARLQVTGTPSLQLWFDVVLQEKQGGMEGENDYATLDIARRAVHMDLVYGRPGAAAAKETTALSPEELRQHPLERLYAPSKTHHVEGGNETASAIHEESSTEDDVWVEFGVGGLKKELRALFRRVFLSRLPSLAPIASALELQHVRGVILYGPPGNGKTLIARNLIHLFGPDTRFSIVNAADVLSKFVGESEKNLRDVFEGFDIGTSAREEDELHEMGKVPGGGRRSGNGALDATLQVLVIDEFEALFRRRGHSSDESSAKAVYDGITNTLLSLMDGVKTRNNLLVVGLTNRLQAIDPALLRPGRFEVLIEIPAPDVPSREEIFFIHTARLRELHYLDSATVHLRDLALQSGGFSGSDIAGTVRAATSHALLRYRTEVAPGAAPPPPYSEAAMDGTPATPAFLVTMEDFESAMREIRGAKESSVSLSQLPTDAPAADTELLDVSNTTGNGFTRVKSLMAQLVASRLTVAGVVALTGGPGSGKTTVSQKIVTLYPFTTVRYVSCERLSELRDWDEGLGVLRDALAEASRAESGVVVLDNYDTLVNLLGEGSPVLAAVRCMLQDYVYRREGVSRALSTDTISQGEGDGLLGATQAEVTANNHRLLVLTATQATTLQDLPADVRWHLPVVSRRDVPDLLALLTVCHAGTECDFIGAKYPNAVSFRTFLRLTDMAVQQVYHSFPPTTWPSVPTYLSTASVLRVGTSEPAVVFTAADPKIKSALSAAVQNVVNNMGLAELYQGWAQPATEEEMEDEWSGDDLVGEFLL